MVKIHQYELKKGILNYFGSNFLAKMYQNILIDNWGYIATSDKAEVLGFITISKNNTSLLKCISFLSLINLFVTFIKNPKNIIKFIIALGKNNKFRLNSQTIEISNFAIKENFQKKGIGNKLISLVEERAKKENYNKIYTRTHNINLMNFYKKKKLAVILNKVKIIDHMVFEIIWKI